MNNIPDIQGYPKTTNCIWMLFLLRSYKFLTVSLSLFLLLLLQLVRYYGYYCYCYRYYCCYNPNHVLLLILPSAFREESNKLRLFVNELAVQRIQLQMEVGRMGRQIRRMSPIEQRFHQVVQREGKSVAEFRQLVQDNVKIQKEIKVNQYNWCHEYAKKA